MAVLDQMFTVGIPPFILSYFIYRTNHEGYYNPKIIDGWTIFRFLHSSILSNNQL